MARTNGNQKGKRYERKLAKVFTDYWGVKFGRTIGSGSYRGVNEDLQTSDIAPERGHGFPFSIEAKHHEGGWTLESAFLNTHSIKEWWQQVVIDAEKAEAIPMLIFTRNYAEDFVMIPYHEETFQKWVQMGNKTMATTVTYHNKLKESDHTWLVMITTLDDFQKVDKNYYKDTFYGDTTWKEMEINIDAPEEQSTSEQAQSVLDMMFGEE